jgi:hypothetical protein
MDGGFDPARDIVAITVNRWPHGYAYEYNPLFDPDWDEADQPHVVGRVPFGRIVVANSDAGAGAYWANSDAGAGAYWASPESRPPFAGSGLNKVNGLPNRSRTAGEPLLARCANAFHQ